jgi:hypothetical protein
MQSLNIPQRQDTSSLHGKDADIGIGRVLACIDESGVKIKAALSCSYTSAPWHPAHYKALRSKIIDAKDCVTTQQTLFRDYYYTCKDLINTMCSENPANWQASKTEFDKMLVKWLGKWSELSDKANEFSCSDASKNDKKWLNIIEQIRVETTSITSEIKLVSEELNRVYLRGCMAIGLRDLFVLPGMQRISDYFLPAKNGEIACTNFIFRLEKGQYNEMRKWLSQSLMKIYKEYGTICGISPAPDCGGSIEHIAAKVWQSRHSKPKLIGIGFICYRNHSLAMRVMTSLLKEAISRYECNDIQQLARQ